MVHYAEKTEVMYHTGLSGEMIDGARYALVPGDPGRVEGLAKALDEGASFVESHRDFTTWKAKVSGRRCSSCPPAWEAPASPSPWRNWPVWG